MDSADLLESWSSILKQLGALGRQLDHWFATLVQPWSLIQLALIAALFFLAHLFARRLEPPFEAWVRRRETSLRRMRLYATVLRRLRPIAFVLLAWIAAAALRQVTAPGRSYLVLVAANLTAAWVALSITSRAIRNPLVSRFVAWTAWIVVALTVLGLTGEVFAVLDAVGFQAGELRITLLGLIEAGLTLVVLFWLAGFVSDATERRISTLQDMSPSLRVLTGKLVRIGLYVVAGIVGLQSIGLDLTSVTVFSGAVGVGLGFGLQKVVSNLVSGIILLLDKSIKPGDVIALGDTFGWITELGARYVLVVTRDGREYLIPNEDLITNQVVNWSHSDQRVRLEVPFGVSYQSDPHRVREVAVAAARKPGRVLAAPEPLCHLTAFGDSSVDFVLRFWIADPANGVVNVRGEVMLALWDALKENGIEIPFPQRDLHLKTPIALAAGEASPARQ